MTPMHYAACFGCADIVYMLIRHSLCSPNTADAVRLPILDVRLQRATSHVCRVVLWVLL